MKDNQDYSLTSMLQRARDAKGRPLTLEERARYVKMASEIEKLEIQLAEAQARDQEAALQREADKRRRKELRLETREDLEEELTILRSELRELSAQEVQEIAEAKSIQRERDRVRRKERRAEKKQTLDDEFDSLTTQFDEAISKNKYPRFWAATFFMVHYISSGLGLLIGVVMIPWLIWKRWHEDD